MRHSDGSFFGRRRGKTLRSTQRQALRERLPELLIDLTRPAPDDLARLFSDPVKEVRLEVGFGGGEHLLHAVRSAPHTGFIGVEPFENGMAKLLAGLGEEPAGTLRLFNRDAVLLLDWLPEGSLAGVDLLYPDPWPKRRHAKRRFVNAENLERLVRVLRPGGTFRFASDADPYVSWTLREVSRHGRLHWAAERIEDCRQPWDGWPGTRYEEKALSEGRRPAYLLFRKPD